MNSPAPKQSPSSLFEKRPPLGIGYLIAVLKKRGHKVYFIDNYIKASFYKKFLMDKRIDYVGMYLDTICFLGGCNILFEIEKMREKGEWSGKIMVGGPHPSVMPESVPDFVDYIVRGEGEKAILDILNGSKEKIIQKEFITDLDMLPSPAWDYFMSLPYNFSCDFFPGEPVFTLNTSRGCPYNCAFCSVGSVWGRQYRTFSAERIIDDINILVSSYGARGIYFREDNFVCDKKRTYNFCELILMKNIEINWACETRVDNLDKDMLTIMNRAGCKGIYFGVESGNQDILDFVNKGITLDQIEDVFAYCKMIGINTYASFLTGLPAETDRELLDTIKFCEKIKPSWRSFNIFVGIPYSKLYAYHKEHNLYAFEDKAGILYTKKHNFLVDQLLGGLPRAKIPEENEKGHKRYLFNKSSLSPKEKKMVSRFFFIQAGSLLIHNHKKEAIRLCISSLRYNIFNWYSFVIIAMTFFPYKVIKIARKMQRKYKPYI